VLAATVDEYHEQITTLEPFASRIQIDLGDGIFATKSVDIADVWWPSTLSPDIHLMHQKPRPALSSLVELTPQMIILHAESEGVEESITYLREHAIRVGLALLQQTSVESVGQLLPLVDHVLIFAGSLGSFGGKADLSLLGKVPKIRAIRPDIEIGWDGGANLENAAVLSKGGIDVINVGSAIQRANHPENAYRTLARSLLALSDE
jgi:ribulose-phosphate 3-epimerase